MKALVKKKAAVGLSLEDVPIPRIGVNDVLIKIQKTSICGTDVHIFEWNDWARRTIQIPLVNLNHCQSM
jgi:threonine 3-dehydrogenase